MKLIPRGILNHRIIRCDRLPHLERAVYSTGNTLVCPDLRMDITIGDVSITFMGSEVDLRTLHLRP